MVRTRKSAASPDEPQRSEPRALDRMWEVIREFMLELEGVRGWKEWQRQKFAHTLNFDDPYPVSASQQMSKEFRFPQEIEKRHAVVMAFLALVDGVESLKECEFYFRRYPFRGLPVGKYRHIVNICEMYFSRIYEIRERVRNAINAVNVLIAPKKLDVGRLLKTFDKIFDQEIRARHSIHHRERFGDVATSRVFLSETLVLHQAQDVKLRRAHLGEYRRLANEWVKRVRRRGQMMDEVLEVVAKAIVENCKFASRKRSD